MGKDSVEMVIPIEDGRRRNDFYDLMVKIDWETGCVFRWERLESVDGKVWAKYKITVESRRVRSGIPDLEVLEYARRRALEAGVALVAT